MQIIIDCTPNCFIYKLPKNSEQINLHNSPKPKGIQSKVISIFCPSTYKLLDFQ